MNNEEIIEFEDRAYANPTLSRDEQMEFIDTLRETMGSNLEQINRGTYNLGSLLPSTHGGLSGAENTFAARYQRPQLESTAANLRATAQASALNTALSNYQNAWKKRYNDAVMAYQKRAAAGSTSPSTTGTPEDGSSLFDTVTQNPTTVKPGEDTTDAALNQAMANASASRQQGGQTSNTEVFMTKVNGQPVYITVYKNTLGQIMGLSDGTANYDQAGARSYLQKLSQAKNLYDPSGNLINYTQAGF